MGAACSCTAPSINCCAGTGNFDEDGCKVEIDLLEQQIQRLYTFKLLLLGAGESGKSTILKQIKIINRWKPSEEEKEKVSSGLRTNIIDCLANIAERAEAFEYKIDSENEGTNKLLIDLKNGDADEEEELWTHENVEKFKKLLKSEAFVETLKRRDEFWLLESFDYLIDNIDRIADPEFEPNDEDMIMARVRTTGIVKTLFDHKVKEDPKLVHFQVVDVGGQRSERKKWMHVFSDVSAVLFVSNLAGYSKRLFEDQKSNRMQESLDLFKQVCGEQAFKDKPVFLIMNKKDLFEQQVQNSDIKKYFEDFAGKEDNMQSVLGFFREKFRKNTNHSIADIFTISAKAKLDVKGLFEEIKKQLYESNRERLAKESGSVKADLKKRRAELAKHAKQEMKG